MSLRAIACPARRDRVQTSSMRRRNEATQSPLGLSANREQITLAFNLAIDKDVVRRILAHHHWPGQSPCGPSWLTFLGHLKESPGVWIRSAVSG